MLEEIIGESGRARSMTRAPGAASTSIATVLSASTVPRSNPTAVVARIRSRGPPSASSTVSREAPKPVAVRSFASAMPAGPSAVGGERQDARARLEMRAHQIERAAMDRRVGRSAAARPAEARRGEAECRSSPAEIRRASPPGVDAACERGAPTPCQWNGSPEASTHTWRPRCAGALRRQGAVERARPGPRRAADQCAPTRLKVPAPAIDDFRRADEPARRRGDGRRRRPRRCRRWTASAAMQQSRARSRRRSTCHASSFSAAPRKRGCSRCGNWRRPPRPRGVTVSLAGRTASPAPECRCRFAAAVLAAPRGRVADYLVGAAHRRADRRHASVRGNVISADAVAAATRSRCAQRGAAASAVDRGQPGDRWIEVERRGGGGSRARGKRRAASSSRSRPPGVGAIRASPADTIISSAVSIRSIRRCRCRT